jgi:hypothetical protein
MGIEPIANSLSPVESVGLTLLEDLIWAQEKGDFAPKLRPNFPIAQNFGRWGEAKKLAARARISALARPFQNSRRLLWSTFLSKQKWAQTWRSPTLAARIRSMAANWEFLKPREHPRVNPAERAICGCLE